MKKKKIKKHRHKWTDHMCDCDRCDYQWMSECKCGAEKEEGERYNPKKFNHV